MNITPKHCSSDLTNTQWEKLLPYLPKSSSVGGPLKGRCTELSTPLFTCLIFNSHIGLIDGLMGEVKALRVQRVNANGVVLGWDANNTCESKFGMEWELLRLINLCELKGRYAISGIVDTAFAEWLGRGQCESPVFHRCRYAAICPFRM